MPPHTWEMESQGLSLLFDDGEARGWAQIPASARRAIEAANAPGRLAAHLILVHDVAAKIADWFEDRWSDLSVDWDAVRFGAAVHDIGKAVELAELVEAGSRHEAAGQRFLVEFGLELELARFAVTHGLDASDPDLGLEDLFVILADKVWKGVRVAELEDRISVEISDELDLDLWDVHVSMLDLLDALAAGADERLSWQTAQLA